MPRLEAGFEITPVKFRPMKMHPRDPLLVLSPTLDLPSADDDISIIMCTPWSRAVHLCPTALRNTLARKKSSPLVRRSCAAKLPAL